MSVKRVMPKGGRKPSKTLWAMVRGLTEEEWRVISAWAVVYRKSPLQFQVLALLRSMEQYDPALEKTTFEGHDLKTLRHAAKHWLIRTATRLAFYQNEVSGQVLDVETLLRWGIHDDIIEFIDEAKQAAKEQEEFEWLALLHKYELRALKIIFEGDERTDRVAAVSLEAMENGKFLTLKAEIEHQAALYLEKGRNGLLTLGKFDIGLAETYFKSKFYRQKIDGWPISFQIQKLRIDEGLHYFLGDSEQAAKAAERLLVLIEHLDARRECKSEDHAKCLLRLSSYYTEQGKKQKALDVVDAFRNLASVTSPFQTTFLRRFNYTLFHAGYQFDLPSLADEGLIVWNRSESFLGALPKDAIRFETLLYVFSYQLSKGNEKGARDAFGKALEVSHLFPYPTFQFVLKIMHLMLLLDEQDERGLKSYGKNYKSHIKAELKKDKDSVVAAIALEIMMLLCKESNLEGKLKLLVSLQKLREKLVLYHNSNDMLLKPFFYPMIKWIDIHFHPM